jgi:lipopolysaccharide heptosyltransferase III
VTDQSIERVVVIFPGAIGDWILALPAFRSLRARHAGARLTMVVSEPLRRLVALSRVADESASLDAAESARIFTGRERPGWLGGRAAVYSWIGARDAGVRKRIATWARSASFFSVERGPGAVHAAVGYARAVGIRGGLRAIASAGRIEPPATLAHERLAVMGPGPVLAIHAGAGAHAKRWDSAGFVQVAEWWRAAGGAVVEILGPAEAGEAPVLGAPVAREWPLADLAALLARVALYLGHDSGVSHLAGAVGAAGVALFGPTDPGRWRPASDRIVALRAHPGGRGGIPLRALPAARVIAACRRRFALTRGGGDTSVASPARN